MLNVTAVSEASVVPGRSCGTCSLCCKVYNLPELQSPAGTWCRHCAPGKGCRIHATRPQICREFFCGWLVSPELGPEWKPERSKLIIQLNQDSNGKLRLTADVDEGFPAAWQRPDIYAKLKQWAKAGAASSTGMTMLVRVVIGRRHVIILPDRDVDVGLVADDEAVMTSERMTAQGVFVEVHKVKRPQAAEPTAQPAFSS